LIWPGPLVLFAALWTGLTGCASGPCRGLGLYQSHLGPSAWEVSICDGGRGAEVFVDGVRWTRACRRSGNRLRCYFTKIGKFPHRLQARVFGWGVLRCTVAHRSAKPSCCVNCKPPKKSKARPRKPS
jgi:hypothetical protein